MIRRIKWYKSMRLASSPTILPRVPSMFLASESWQEQLHTLNRDYRRMPAMHSMGVDVVRLNARFAAQVNAEGYTQGFLYLLQGLAWVFGRDESVLYWAFLHLVRVTRPYGPLGKSMGNKHPVVTHVMQFADPVIRETHLNLLRDMITVRWCFIMFSQTFVRRQDLLCVWDLVMEDPVYLPCVAAAILRLYRFADKPDTLERVTATVDVQIDTVEATARVVAAAMRIRVSLPKHILLTARQLT